MATRPAVEDGRNKTKDGTGQVNSSNGNNPLAAAADNYTNTYEYRLNKMYQSQILDYNKNTVPIIDQLVDETTSTQIVDSSRRLSEQLQGKTEEMTQRQLGYSMGGTLASRQASLTNNQRHSVTKARNAVMTQAHDDQRNRQQAARTELMSISEQLQQSGQASMSQAYMAKNQREQAYKSAKTGFMSQAGAVVGGVIGGIYGGPAGASAGAAVGSAAGGAMGS